MAAHITAAAKGGPRYNPALSNGERKAATNGIWLCQNCAKHIDNDILRYPEVLLREWKRRAEEWALAQVGKTSSGAESSSSVSQVQIIHPLQRAAHFLGRSSIITELQSWWKDEGSSYRCRSIQGFGGTGKTAIVDRFIEWIRRTMTGDAVFIWSFYDDDNAKKMLTSLSSWTSTLMNQRSLLVLDGLERVQSDGTGERSRGSILDSDLRLLLRRVAGGATAFRILTTSRFPLVDLDGWKGTSFAEHPLEHLTASEAVALLRALGVQDTDAHLDYIASQCGYHALTLTVWGSYLANYSDGSSRPELELDIDDVGSDLREARVLKRCLTEHALALSDRERDAMCQLARQGAWSAFSFNPPAILAKLQKLGLVSRSTDSGVYIVHPAVREFFAALSGVERSSIKDVMFTQTVELEERPRSFHGECERCGEPALIETAWCSECEEDVEIPGEPDSIIDENGHLVAYFADPRTGDSNPLQCPTCDTTQLDYEFESYCSYCEYISEKDD